VLIYHCLIQLPCSAAVMSDSLADEIEAIIQRLNDFDQSKANPRAVVATDNILRRIRLAAPEDDAIKELTIAIKTAIGHLFMPPPESDREATKEKIRRLCGDLKLRLEPASGHS